MFYVFNAILYLPSNLILWIFHHYYFLKLFSGSSVVKHCALRYNHSDGERRCSGDRHASGADVN